jgi:hypothetical protein
MFYNILLSVTLWKALFEHFDVISLPSQPLLPPPPHFCKQTHLCATCIPTATLCFNKFCQPWCHTVAGSWILCQRWRLLESTCLWRRRKLAEKKWRRGIVVIAPATRTEDRGFESRRGVRLMDLNAMRCCCQNLMCIVIVLRIREKIMFKNILHSSNNLLMYGHKSFLILNSRLWDWCRSKKMQLRYRQYHRVKKSSRYCFFPNEHCINVDGETQ